MYRTLPAKSAAEEKRHQKLYEEMVAAARRKGDLIVLVPNVLLDFDQELGVCCRHAELQKAKEAIEKEKQKRQRDKMVTDSLQVWQKVLPNWENT